MEIKEISNKNIWESFIARYSPEALFQSWNWSEAVRKDQKIWRWGFFDNDKLIGTAQVTKVIARRGVFLHIRHGPVFSSLSNTYFKFFLDFLVKLALKEKAQFIRISPLLYNTAENRCFLKNLGFRDSPIHAMDGEYCWVLDLKDDDDILLSRMRKTTRYLIRKAQEMNIVIEKSKNIDDMEDFLVLYEKTASRHNFVQHRGIKEEFRQFLQEDRILLFKGFYEKKLLSAALIIFYNNQAIYHHSASIEQKIPVNYLLQWEVIKEAKRRGLRLYNFWGIAPSEKKNHPWRGLSLFKIGFGGRVVEYIHAQDLPLRYSYCATYLYESLRKFWKNY